VEKDGLGCGLMERGELMGGLLLEVTALVMGEGDEFCGRLTGAFGELLGDVDGFEGAGTIGAGDAACMLVGGFDVEGHCDAPTPPANGPPHVCIS
jgi:hypothetical protein